MVFPHVLLKRRVVAVLVLTARNDAGVLKIFLLLVVYLHMLFEVGVGGEAALADLTLVRAGPRMQSGVSYKVADLYQNIR